MNYGHGPGPYIFGDAAGLEKSIDMFLAQEDKAMMTVYCPVCKEEVEGIPDGKLFTVGDHGSPSCEGVDASVGEESLVKQPGTASHAA